MIPAQTLCFKCEHWYHDDQSPHCPHRPVETVNVGALKDKLIRAYNQKNDVLFDEALNELLGLVTK